MQLTELSTQEALGGFLAFCSRFTRVLNCF